MNTARKIPLLTPGQTPLLLTRSLAAGTGTFALAMASAMAAPPDTSSWECKYCPFESGSRGDYSVGATQVSDDAARYGIGTGYDEAGTYVLLDGEGATSGDRLLVDWQFEDLGVDSRAAAVSLTNP